MKQVKGTVIIAIIKLIKTSRQERGEYDRILSSNAKKLLNQRILTGTWYPFELYRECFDALCYIEAKNDPKTIVKWGELDGKRRFSLLYQSTVIKGDIQLAAEKCIRFHKRIMNFGEIIPEFLSDNEVKFTYTDMPRDWKNYYYIAAGTSIAFIENCINKKIDYAYLNKSWINEGWTVIKFSWIN